MPVSVYLNDVEDICRMWQVEGIDLKVESDGYLYDGIDDFADKNTGVCNHLLLSGEIENSECSLQIGRKWVTIDSKRRESDGNVDARMYRALDRTASLLRKKERDRFVFPTLIGLTLLFSVFGWNVENNIAEATADVGLGALMFSVVMTMMVTVTLYHFKPVLSCKIYLIRKQERESFLRRNKDKIVITVLATLLGALLSWLFL